MSRNHTTEDIQRRLEILRGKLEMEGSYVSANTVILAQELIRETTGVDVPASSIADREDRD